MASSRRCSPPAFLALMLLVGCGVAAPPAQPTPAARVLSAAPAPVGLTSVGPGVFRVAPPISLTAPDGTPFRITALRSTASIDDPLATTELHFSVENPSTGAGTPRLLMSLPRSSRVRRAAIRRGTTWTEVSAAPSERLSVTYAELVAGSATPRAFDAPESGALDAVFPELAPGEQAEIVVVYDELLTGAPYVQRLRGLPPLDVLSARVDIAGDATPAADVELAGAAPDGDIVVPEGRYLRGSVEARALASGDDVAVRVTLPDGLKDQDPLVAPIVLIDTSASAALEVSQSLAMLRALLASAPADLPVRVAAFDDTVEPIFDGRAGDFGDGAASELFVHRALGVANLEKALRWAAEEARSSKLNRRLIVFSSGHASAGVTTAANMGSAISALGDAGIVRADVIAPRRARDGERLDLLAHAGKGRGAVLDADLAPTVISRRLQRRPRGPTAIAVAQADALSDTSFTDARPGDTLAFVAHVAHATGELAVSVGGEMRAVSIVRAGGDLTPALDAFRAPRIDGPASMLAPGGTTSGVARGVLVRDAVAAQRFVLDEKAEIIDPGASSADPLNGTVASNVAPVPEVAAPSPEPEKTEAPAVDAGEEDIHGPLPQEVVRRIIRINFGRFKACYIDLLRRHPKTTGRVTTKFHIEADGGVHDAGVAADASDIHDQPMNDCMSEAFSKLSFPASGGPVSVSYPIVFSTDAAAGAPEGHHLEAGRATPKAPTIAKEDDTFQEPVAGRLLAIRRALTEGRTRDALTDASAWTTDAPGDPLAYVALGDAATMAGDTMLAERAYGSILDLWSDRADMARFAGERLELVTTTPALELARDAYLRAIELRPEEPTSYHLEAFAELRLGHTELAFRGLAHTLEQKAAHDTFLGARGTLAEDLGLIGAVWASEEPSRKADIEARLEANGAGLDTEKSLRIVLVWETDSANVSLRVRDATARPDLDQMKSARATIKGAYGPDELAVRGATRHYPYAVSADLAKGSGPMGFSMGKLEIVDHDGKGQLTFEERPFVVMNGVPRVDLGTILLAHGPASVPR